MKRILFTLVYLGSVAFAADQNVSDPMALSRILNDDTALTNPTPSNAPRVSAATSSSSSQRSITIPWTAPVLSDSNDGVYEFCMYTYPDFARFIDCGGDMQSSLNKFETLNPDEMSKVLSFCSSRNAGFRVVLQLSENDRLKFFFDYMRPRYRDLYRSPELRGEYYTAMCRVKEQCKLNIATSEVDCALVDKASALVYGCTPSNSALDSIDDIYYRLLGHLPTEQKIQHCQWAIHRSHVFYENADPILGEARALTFIPAQHKK